MGNCCLQSLTVWTPGDCTVNEGITTLSSVKTFRLTLSGDSVSHQGHRHLDSDQPDARWHTGKFFDFGRFQPVAFLIHGSFLTTVSYLFGNI